MGVWFVWTWLWLSIAKPNWRRRGSFVAMRPGDPFNTPSKSDSAFQFWLDADFARHREDVFVAAGLTIDRRDNNVPPQMKSSAEETCAADAMLRSREVIAQRYVAIYYHNLLPA